MDIFVVVLAGCRLEGCSHCSATVSCEPACGLYRYWLPAYQYVDLLSWLLIFSL